MKRLRLIVVGTLASNPYAGMAWMHMQIASGLKRLGHEVYYFEVTSAWPFDPFRETKVNDSEYAIPYLARVAKDFDMGDNWAYRRSYSDNEWFGVSKKKAEDLLSTADAVFNVAGATGVRSSEDLKVKRLVYFGTDPVFGELAYANGDADVKAMVEEHDDFVTYGENIGTKHSPVPPYPKLKSRTRQPVLLDLWRTNVPQRAEFTTVCNWKQTGFEIEFKGETYYWSKHREFLKFVDLPLLVHAPIEVAMGLDDASFVEPEPGQPPPESGMSWEERTLLEAKGWKLVHPKFTMNPWTYRDYVCASKGEFTVAKDQNVRLRSGWFSERSACYLAASRPVITQDTGFSTVLPTGEGLFSFNTMEEILAAFESIQSSYEKHSHAARAIAEEYFRAESVLSKMLKDLQF